MTPSSCHELEPRRPPSNRLWRSGTHGGHEHAVDLKHGRRFDGWHTGRREYGPKPLLHEALIRFGGLPDVDDPCTSGCDRFNVGDLPIRNPAGVDRLPVRSGVPHLLDIVASHAGATRAGFLAFAAAMVLMIPALSIVRQCVRAGLAGQALVSAGARLAAVAAGAAIGDSFAPATPPTAVRPNLPRGVMITYVGDHLFSGWDWVILAFYPLLPLGALLLAIGLWRGAALDRLTIILVTPRV
jgi:hypothetical protein